MKRFYAGMGSSYSKNLGRGFQIYLPVTFLFPFLPNDYMFMNNEHQ